jgi:hypothetical protein
VGVQISPNLMNTTPSPLMPNSYYCSSTSVMKNLPNVK